MSVAGIRNWSNSESNGARLGLREVYLPNHVVIGAGNDQRPAVIHKAGFSRLADACDGLRGPEGCGVDDNHGTIESRIGRRVNTDCGSRAHCFGLGERCAPATAAGYSETLAIRGESDVIWGDIHADGACHKSGFSVYHSDCIADAEGDKGLLTIRGNGDSGDLRVFEALTTSGKSSGDIWRFVILKRRVHNPCCTGCWTSIRCDIDHRDLST